MANLVIVFICALCCLLNRTISAPIIKASGAKMCNVVSYFKLGPGNLGECRMSNAPAIPHPFEGMLLWDQNNKYGSPASCLKQNSFSLNSQQYISTRYSDPNRPAKGTPFHISFVSGQAKCRVQWSEPKGTGKGNITLIMIPQNNSCGNDSDMIVAVKSDYQIVSQDTQLLNLVVNENTNNKTNSSKFHPSSKKGVNLNEDCANKDEQETLKHPNTAKYFESENKLSSENTTNNTVNIYPLLLKNYQNLVALNGNSTTISYNTLDIFQLLSTSMSNNKFDSSNTEKVSSDSHLNTTTSSYEALKSTEQNNHSLTSDNIVNSKSANIPVSMVGSDDNFLSEALNILDKLKQDPSYYNKLKSNQVPSTEEIKGHGDISLVDSKTKLFKSDDSALASDEGEGYYREFGNIGNMNQENQDISKLEGSVNENNPNSTCLPFFMSLTTEQSTTQLIDLNNPKRVSFENVPLKGVGSNVPQELNPSSSDKNSSLSSTPCKSLVPSSFVEEISQTDKNPVENKVNISVGYGVQSNDVSQTLSAKSCSPINVLSTESTSLNIASNKPDYVVGVAENSTKVQPIYLQQTLAAAKIAQGSELSKTDSFNSLAITTSVPISGYDNYLSKTQTECITSAKTSGNLEPPKLEQANKAPSAGQMKPPSGSENQMLKFSQTITPVTQSDGINRSLLPKPVVSFNGSTSQSLSRPNEPEMKSAECVSNALQTAPPIIVSPTSVRIGAAGFNGLSEMQTECATDPNMKQELGLPQAGVGAVLKKITLDPQVSCGTIKKEESSTISRIEGQEACLSDKDLTLPLVKSSIFLANNNEMPKGKDIPIFLNASLDEFSLSDLQEREDRMHGKVAELYNRNPIMFNIEREPTGTPLKPQLKYYKSEIFKKPTIHFDKIYNPDSNQILKLNFAGKNVILEQRPSLKYDTRNRIFNSNSENKNKLTNYEIEPVDSDNISVKPEPTVITTPQIIISSKSDVYDEHFDTTTNPLDSHQPANEEEQLLTILNTLDKTTVSINYKYKSQDNNSTLEDITTNLPNNNLVSIPIPVNEYTIFNPQESGQSKNNVGSTLGQQDSENVDSQLNNMFNWTTKQPHLSQKSNSKPKNRLPGRICSKPHQTKTSKVKENPDSSSKSSTYEIIQNTNSMAKDKMCIPADSLQKIVIEIVRNTKKPENKPNRYEVQTSYDNHENGVQNVGKENDNMDVKKMRNIKPNFVPFQSAWKPVQAKDKQTNFPLSNSIHQNSVYSSEKVKDVLNNQIYETDGVQEKFFLNQNNNRLFENQDNFKQEKRPPIIKEYSSPFKPNSANYETSLGANILKLIMANKSVVTSK